MAIFDQRAELSRQKRHVAAQWDDDNFNKALGFNKRGGRNAWGQFLGAIPGLNTATHAIAKSRAGGSTKDVLEETFDEAVAKDFAGAAFGVNIAKTVMGGGLGGGLGQGMKGMFGGAGNIADATGAASSALGAAGQTVDSGAGLANKAMGVADKISGRGGFLNGLKNTFGGGNNQSSLNSPLPGDLKGVMDAFKSQSDDVQMENMKNPFEPGSDEYNQFEREMEDKQKDKNKGTFAEGIKGFIGDAATGNIFETGADWATSFIASERASKDAQKDAATGTFAYNPEFNYL
jgi:hypothetical protein